MAAVRKRRTDGRPTIADVALRAGVGAITVSRALRNPDSVSEPLRRNIETAIRELQYLPNRNAQAIASARTDSVGVLVPALTLSIFSDVLRGVYDGMADSRLRVEIANTRYDPALEEVQIAEMLRHNPSGIIVSGVHQTDAARRLLEGADCPVIQIMDLHPDPVHRIIGFSHHEGGRAMTQHMIDMGYRRIAFFGAWMSERSMGRITGYQEALEGAGLFDPSLIMKTSDHPPSSSNDNPHDWNRFGDPAVGRKLLIQARQIAPDIDAVFCNNDVIALGVLFECIAQGIRVPEDLGIAGFNDVEFAAAAEPALSSLRTPRWEIGYGAAQAVLDELAGRTNRQRVVDMGVEVMKRDSTDRDRTLRPTGRPTTDAVAGQPR